ncbi:TadE/TadG family type IV pilus assembly protein [Methylopila sp. M107]|uniref:TadE/TadG family type IV pilus assembly protein n=1 Tax=Methylopila sp. M107 TaxID=1101190 RepID=UPI00036F0F20|nr:TadE/TadG family type IV pilus assembly protein [Methylopila sp. M107]
MSETRTGRALHAIRTRGARFARDAHGVAAIEFALIAPIMVLMLLGATFYFDATRDRARVERAAYVIADSVGRKQTVDTTFLDLMNSLALNVAKSNDTPEIRVTSVSRVSLLELKVDWSYPTGTFAALKSSDIPALGYPVSIPVGGSAIIAETRATYTPTFAMFGVSKRTHTGVSFARPRLVGMISKTN